MMFWSIVLDILIVFKNIKIGAGDMAQKLRVLTSLAEAWGLVLSTHIKYLIATCNSSSTGFNDLFGHPHQCVHTHI